MAVPHLSSVLVLGMGLVGSASAFGLSWAPTLIAQARGGALMARSGFASRPGLSLARGRVQLRRGVVQLRASDSADGGEERKFKIGDAVEAEWIGDDCFYPGTIEGYFTEGRYDVKWADPQGMADAQPTPEENIKEFDPVKYYRYGLGAWEAGDTGLAYLCMRTVYICVGPFAKTEEYLEKLMEEPMVKELMATRRDSSPFAARQSTRERVADSTTTIQKVGDEKEPLPEPEQGQFYDDAEIEQLRGQAQEQNMYQNMWLQYNQANKMQKGTWYGLWEDYTVSKRKLVKQQDRKSTHDFQTYLDDEGLPEFAMLKDDTKTVGAFYPMAQANWFVDKAYTTAEVTGEGDAKKLEMEIGLSLTCIADVCGICTGFRLYHGPMPLSRTDHRPIAD
jgi:hypothetical protein